MDQTRLNYFVLTGGPGAGKTTLIEALAARGYAIVPESGRALMIEKKRAGWTGDPPTHPPDFGRAMLVRDIANYDAAPKDGLVFFDHAAIGNLGYARMMDFAFEPALIHAARGRRYNPLVFAAPPWPEIYINDEERKQSWEDALSVHHHVREIYAEEGYTLVELPRDTVEARVRFVLERAQFSPLPR